MEYVNVQRWIIELLQAIGFTGGNPVPIEEGVPISEETRREGLTELARYM